MKSIVISTLAGRITSIHYENEKQADEAFDKVHSLMISKEHVLLTLAQPGCKFVGWADGIESVTSVHAEIQAQIEGELDELYDQPILHTLGRA